MQRAPEYRAIAEQVYRLATQKFAAPAPGSAALEQPDVAAGGPGAPAHGRRARPRRDRARQHRLPGAAAARPRELQLGELGRMGEARARPTRSRARANSSRRRAGSDTPCSTSPTATARRHRPRPPTRARRKPRPCATSSRSASIPAPDPERMLLRRERPEWNNRPSHAPRLHRRQLPHRRAGRRRSRRLRRSEAFVGDRERLEPRFGVSWFLLPNPIYGSWTKPYDTLEQKYAGLRIDDSGAANCPAAVPGRTAPPACASRAGTSSTS